MNRKDRTALVSRMIELKNTGMGFHAIAENLNAGGFRSSSGREFNAHSVSYYLLRAGIYTKAPRKPYTRKPKQENTTAVVSKKDDALAIAELILGSRIQNKEQLAVKVLQHIRG